MSNYFYKAIIPKLTVFLLLYVYSVSVFSIDITGNISIATIDNSPQFSNISNSDIFLFHEKKSILLNGDQAVDLSTPGIYTANCLATDTDGLCVEGEPGVLEDSPTPIPANTRIDSFLLHFDPINKSQVSGSITFDQEILGVIISDALLNETDYPLGMPATNYPSTVTNRGLEIDIPIGSYDGISFGGNTLNILNLQADLPGDQIRVLVKSHEPVTVEYELIDLGIVTPSVLLVINESGQVAGTGFFDGIARAFMYDGTTVINLDPESTMTSMAYSINDSGDVVGYTYPYVSSVDRYLSRATLFSNGTITNLGVQVAPLWNKLTSSRASAINNTGTIVGNSSVLLNGSIQYAAVNFGESITVLPGVTGLSYVTGINNNNVSVGQIGFSYKEAAIFTDTGIIKPFAQHPEIRGSTARSISDSGLVVGSILQPDLSTDLFIYDMHSRRNTYIDFGISPYSRLAIGESSRIDVNSQGQVIGFKIGQSGAFGPFVYYYETGQYVELATQFYDLGWTLSSVSGINDKGQIVGTGFFNGERRAVILNPIKNNSDPVLQPIGNLLINEGELFELTLHATDPDGDTLSFSMSNAPLGATLDAITGVFQWTPDFTQAGTYSDIEFIVTDSGNPIGIDAEIISITVGNTNRPPTITPIGQILVEENESIFFHVDAIDPDGDNVSIVAQLQNLSDGQRLAGVLPEGARFSIDNNFSWTPDFTQNGTYIIDFHATDSGTPNLTTTNSVVITVGNTSNPVSLSSFIVEQIIQTPLSQSLVNATIANMKKVGKFIEAGRVQAARNQVASFKNKIVLATEQGEIDAINAQKLTGLGDELLNLLN